MLIMVTECSSHQIMSKCYILSALRNLSHAMEGILRGKTMLPVPSHRPDKVMRSLMHQAVAAGAGQVHTTIAQLAYSLYVLDLGDCVTAPLLLILPAWLAWPAAGLLKHDTLLLGRETRPQLCLKDKLSCHLLFYRSTWQACSSQQACLCCRVCAGMPASECNTRYHRSSLLVIPPDSTPSDVGCGAPASFCFNTGSFSCQGCRAQLARAKTQVLTTAHP
jgi:hypothetical protein